MSRTSRGAYKGLQQIDGIERGDRVTVLAEFDVEAVEDLECPGFDADGQPVIVRSKYVRFGGGAVLEFPTEQDAARTNVQMTVRKKR